MAKRKGIIVLIITLFTMLSLQAQDELFFSKASSKLFTRNELRELIKLSAYQTVKGHGVPYTIFDNNYNKLEHQLLVTGRPRIMQATRWIESSGLGNREKRIGLYKQEIYRAVRDVVMSNAAFEILYAFDQTDRILKFFSDVKVNKNGELDVTEYITIYNGSGTQSDLYREQHPDEPDQVNDDIKHGLERDFPTHYKNKIGLNEVVPFEVYEVRVNDEEGQYHLYEHDNGVSLRVGTADVYIPDGIYEYKIRYRTRQQLIFHISNDELYWNVNGTGWVFTADSVGSRFTFPAGAKIAKQACYTGTFGVTETECISKLINDSTIFFKATRRLNAYEGLTVAASIQKGILQPPSKFGSFIALMKDNWPIPAALAMLLLLLGINLGNWLRYGKDPKQSTIIPRFEPPDGIWPADAGYIYHQKYKPEQFSAALVDLAVKKAITISVVKEGRIFKNNAYYFSRGTDKHNAIKYFAQRAYDWDLKDLYDQKASGEYNSAIGDLNSKLEQHLENKFRIDAVGNEKKRGLFSWNSTKGSWGFILLFVLGFAALIVVSKMYTLVLMLIMITLFVLGFIMQYVFYKIMPAYTKDGQQVVDELLGFKMYLSTAEERRFDKLNPPEKTLQLFERHLPYAIALECQNEWADKFESILKEAIASNTYHPTYYSGGDMSSDMSFSSISDSISSGLSGTIASASTAPSSSSGSDSGGGSDGGGSSGGGGGGGGGGGW